MLITHTTDSIHTTRHTIHYSTGRKTLSSQAAQFSTNHGILC